MLFTSWSFIAFIAAVLTAYYLAPGRLQWLLLLTADVIFYACAGWQGLVFMSATVLTSWFFTNRMRDSLERQRACIAGGAMSREERRAYRAGMEKKRRAMLTAALTVDLGILAVLKYTGFAINNVNALFGSSLAGVDWVLPLGISFYTFQTVSYVVDVYWEKVEAERSVLRVALFTSFFPLLIQGPISRWGELTRTLFQPHRADLAQIRLGLARALWGYFKKLVVADRLLVAVTALCGSPSEYGGSYVVIAALLYAAELYADFTGGIDITIGIAQALGISVQENFVRPYFSRSIAEYWRRWHISMGVWFKDYVFYPLSVSYWLLSLSRAAKERVSAGLGRKLPVYVSTVVTWFLTGLWHGAAWNFVVWGLLNAAFILAAEEFKPASERFRARYPALTGSFGYRVFETARTFLLMCALRTLDCYRDVPLTFRMWGSVFTEWNWAQAFSGPLMALGLTAGDYIAAAAGVALMLVVSVFQETRGGVRQALEERSCWVRGAVYTGLLLAVLVFGAYGVGYDSAQFIYNQF